MKTRIKELRKHLGKTQAQFADLVDIPQSNIASYESGRRSPSTRTLVQIAQRTGCNQEWLICGDGEMLSENTSVQLLARLTTMLYAEPEGSERLRLFMRLLAYDDKRVSAVNGILDVIEML